jgi:hypothetical protein
MSDLKYPTWQKRYQEALMETNQEKLVARAAVAQWTILSRLREIRIGVDGFAEAKAIEDALSGLSVLKNDRSSQDSQNAGTRYNTNQKLRAISIETIPVL